MKLLRNSFWALVCAILMSSSCSEPQWEESFLRVDEISYDGRYYYTLDFSDSTALYDVIFYAKYERQPEEASFPLTVRWVSPSDSTFSEKVYMRTDSQTVPYRMSISPWEYGEWELSVLAAKVDGILGLGVINKKRDGTR